MDNDLLPGKTPFTGAAEIAHLLGRIESSLIDIRSDIQASTKVQESTNDEIRRIDRRVIDLEGREDLRKRSSRVVAAIALGLLIPALSAVNQAHAWFSTVNSTCFPRR